MYSNENYSYPTGFYSEDFSDNLSQGWSRGWSQYSNTSNYGSVNWESLAFQYDGNGYYNSYDYSNVSGQFEIRRDCCYDSDYYETRIESPNFSLLGLSDSLTVSFETRETSWWSGTRYELHYYSINNGEWMLLDTYSNPGNTWSGYQYLITLPEGANSIKFRISHRLRYYGIFELDNFSIESSRNDLIILPLLYASAINDSRSEVFNGVEAEPRFSTLSTGGIQLNGSQMYGDFQAINEIHLTLSCQTQRS